MHTVEQSDSRSLHTPGGAGVTGVVGMLIGVPGVIGDDEPGPLGTAGLAPGTEGAVGLAGTGTAGEAPGLDAAGVTGPGLLGVVPGEAVVVGMLGELPGAGTTGGEAVLPGAGTTGVPGTLGTPLVGAAIVEGTGEPALLDGLVGVPAVGDAGAGVVGLLGVTATGEEPVFGKTGEAKPLGPGLG